MSSSHHHDAEAAPHPESPPKLTSASISEDTHDHDDHEHPVGALPVPPVDKRRAGLHRALSARQVSMIAIAGTIGTGLFLGTGKSLAQGGPASMLLGYAIVGFIVYITLLLLGEMATQYPVAGEYDYLRKLWTCEDWNETPHVGLRWLQMPYSSRR